ncbi:hypothetical protein P8936_10565 [Edaphobacter paludis]|uniref:Uncharacterized protein n=1 Tax=Edaphobacter paludis TaxID=3035702 RepID=A0AAU7D5M3_9BACT
MTALESLLAGLIDYAGLYPPAALDMRTALRNYVSYGRSQHASALGHFIVDINRLTELREVAGDSTRHVRLSLLVSATTDWDSLAGLLHEGFTIDTIEIKTDHPSQIARIARCIPPDLTTYFEVPFDSHASEALEAISAAGARAKLRMGGIVANAFPATLTVADMLKALADRRIPFKATAGLHHPIRSHHPFTYAPDSPSGTMHGFLNLCCSAALLYFGGQVSHAILLLDEQDPGAWHITPDAIAWRNVRWSTDQLRSVREKFFTSFGSCSFAEPMDDLEALGWR